MLNRLKTNGIGGHTNRMAAMMLAALLLLLPLFSIAATPAATAPVATELRAQAALLQTAEEHPDDTVGVIVQKAIRGDNVERLVTKLGGVVTRDLSVINAFAAQLPGRAVATLAGAEGVRWVSLDAPVVDAFTLPSASFTTWATQAGASVVSTFANAAAMVDSALGPNGTYGYGSRAKGSFAGLVPQTRP